MPAMSNYSNGSRQDQASRILYKITVHATACVECLTGLEGTPSSSRSGPGARTSAVGLTRNTRLSRLDGQHAATIGGDFAVGAIEFLPERGEARVRDDLGTGTEVEHLDGNPAVVTRSDQRVEDRLEVDLAHAGA